MAKLNLLLKTHMESVESEVIVPGDERVESVDETLPEIIEEENRLQKEEDDLTTAISAQVSIDEVIDQQEANLNEMGDVNVRIDEDIKVAPSIEINQNTEEEIENSTVAIEEQIMKETAVMENISGMMGFSSDFTTSGYFKVSKSLGINSRRIGISDIATESRYKTGKSRLQAQKQLYKEHYEGFVETSKKFASNVWDGIKAMFQRVLDFITSWFKTDYKKIGMSFKEKIKSLRSKGNLEMSESLVNYDNTERGIGLLMCLTNPKALYAHTHMVSFSLSEIFKQITKIDTRNPKDWLEQFRKSMHDEIEKLGGKQEALHFDGVDFKNKPRNTVFFINQNGMFGLGSAGLTMGVVKEDIVNIKIPFSSADEALDQVDELSDFLINYAPKLSKDIKEHQNNVKGVFSLVGKLREVGNNPNVGREYRKEIMTTLNLSSMLVRAIPTGITEVTKTCSYILKNIKVAS